MSVAQYIIICDGRINVALAKNGYEMIRAASAAATALTSSYGDRLSEADALPISKLQHQMMDVVSGKNIAGTHANDFKSAGGMVDEMFALLDALEQKMES